MTSASLVLLNISQVSRVVLWFAGNFTGNTVPGTMVRGWGVCCATSFPVGYFHSIH